MKIIRLLSRGEQLRADFHPDSALLLPGRPFFIPDFGEKWEADLYLAVKIGRLGKNIGERFASRYYDAASLAIHFRSTDNSLCDGLLSGADSTIAIGNYIAPVTITDEMKISFNDDTENILPQASQVESAISEVSQLSTLKMGDILMFPLPYTHGIPIKASTCLSASMNGERLLEIKCI